MPSHDNENHENLVHRAPAVASEGLKSAPSATAAPSNLMHQAMLSNRGFWFGNGPIPINDTLSICIGFIMLSVLLPLVGTVVALTVLWDFVDRVGRGRPQDGAVMSFARWLNRASLPLTSRFMKHPEDGFIVNVFLSLGVGIPALFFACCYYTMHYGFNLYLCVFYHILRLGPYFMNFAYVYTLCHKEGHSRQGLWAEPYNTCLRNAFNWWISLFYGVMPSSFAFGHSINHHKYNNGPLDVVSNSDVPRDSFINWVRYLPRWSLYALNISTIRQFISERRYTIAFRMFLGSVYYACWVYVMYRVSPLFCLTYVLFPVGENILLLACINWCWHAFMDPSNPEDPYVGSVTLFDGPINVLNEDYHVVHHQYPGAHWTEHPDKYAKHESRGDYKTHEASAFKGTHAFELFALIILRKYDEIAEKFVDMSGKYPTHEDKVRVVQQRLRTCWWGPLANVKYDQHGWEGVEDTDGY